MIKKIFSYIGIGIALGCVLFTINCMILFLIGGANFLEPIVNNYLNQVLGSILVGIAFAVPSLIYDSDKITIGKKVLFHMIIGFMVYFPLAFYFKWIPLNKGFKIIVFYILLAFTISLFIWIGFYYYNKGEAKLINKKLKEVQKYKKQ